MMDVDALNQRMVGSFTEKLGFKYTEASPDGLKATLAVREDLCTVPGTMHGGALMTMADALGAAGTGLNLPPGAGTTTIESKTNFFAPVRTGTTITAECTPLHRGKSTMVWQTRFETEDGKLAALVTQTQIVLAAT